MNFRSLLKICNNILLCVIWLDRNCGWTCATAPLYINIYLYRECCKTSFICGFNLTGGFLIFCSWWPADEQYLFAALYQCKITWLSKSHADNLPGDVISPVTLWSVVPRDMQGLFRKLQSFIGKSVQSLSPSVKKHLLTQGIRAWH